MLQIGARHTSLYFVDHFVATKQASPRFTPITLYMYLRCSCCLLCVFVLENLPLTLFC